MKQKLLLTVLTVSALAFTLTACGGTQKTSESEPVVAQETQGEGTQVEETKEEDPTTQESESMEPKQAEPFDTTATMEETILVDENDIKITATGLNYNDYAVELSLTIENNSAQDLTFFSGSTGYGCNAINGYMFDTGYLSADVAAGKKSNEVLSFSMDEFAIYGLTSIADIQVGFDIMDQNYDHVYTGPKQIKTTLADSYDYTVNTYREAMDRGNYTIDYYAEEELYNQNDIKIVSAALATNKDGEQALLLEIENNSAEFVRGNAKDIFVNGLEVYSGLWTTTSVNPGTRRIMYLSIPSLLKEPYKETFGITDIGEFTFSFFVKDTEFNDLIPSQEISISISDEKTAFDTSGEELYNENGIRIISKGLFEDPSEFNDNIHMLLLVENNYTSSISISDVYDSLSVNGYMTGYFGGEAKISSGKCAIVDISLQASSLEDNGIAGIEEITDAEIVFEIKDDSYKDIAEAKVAITY